MTQNKRKLMVNHNLNLFSLNLDHNQHANMTALYYSRPPQLHNYSNKNEKKMEKHLRFHKY